jgi:hypothetical protein
VTDRADKTTADRLTLVSHVEWLELEEPVFVQPGERYWVDWENRCLVVEDPSGERRTMPGAWRGGLDARR